VTKTSGVDRQTGEAADPREPAAYLAELIGTFLLVFFVCGVISVGTNTTLRLDLAGLGLLHALVLMVLVYALGGTSGAHFNPAVTLALLSVRKISPPHAAIYMGCQLAGGLMGALVVGLLFKEIGDGVNYGATAINTTVLQGGSAWLGLIAEALGTFMLMWAIMGVAVNPRGPAALAGLAIGGALGVAVMVFGPATGAGLNPARWLGPAVVSGEFGDFWIYLLGPALGAVAAAVGYRALILERRELPPVRPKDELAG
jgi:MIP family channel proteins